MNFSATLVLLLSIYATPHSSASPANPSQPVLSLDQAISEAKSHSPAFLRAKAATSEASWRQLEMLAPNLPRLSISANHFFAEKYTLLTVPFGGNTVTFPTIFPKTTVSLDAAWTLFDGLATPYAFGAARLQSHAVDLELERVGLQLESEVRLRFYQALGAEALATVADQNLKTLREHLERAKELLNRGKVTRFDTLRVSVQLEEAGPEKQQADDNVITARGALAVAMGLDPSDARPVTGTLPKPTVPRNINDLKADPASRSDIEALTLRSHAADKNAKSAVGQFLPKITVAGNRTFYNNVDRELSFNSPQESHVAYSLGIFLTWNIFDGGASIARQREAVYQREMAEQTARAALLRAPQDIEIWRRRMISNEALYRARLRAIEAAEESVRLARLSYAAGTRTSTDVLDAELDLFRARAGVVRAQLDAAESLINLELALGRRL